MELSNPQNLQNPQDPCDGHIYLLNLPSTNQLQVGNICHIIDGWYGIGTQAGSMNYPSKHQKHAPAKLLFGQLGMLPDHSSMLCRGSIPTCIQIINLLRRDIHHTILESEYGFGTIPNRNSVKSLEIKQVSMFDVFIPVWLQRMMCVLLIFSNPQKSNQNTSLRQTQPLNFQVQSLAVVQTFKEYRITTEFNTRNLWHFFFLLLRRRCRQRRVAMELSLSCEVIDQCSGQPGPPATEIRVKNSRPY